MFNKFRIFINLRISVHLEELNKDKGKTLLKFNNQTVFVIMNYAMVCQVQKYLQLPDFGLIYPAKLRYTSDEELDWSIYNVNF